MYYKLKHQAGTKETGPVFPQVNCTTLALAHTIEYHTKAPELPTLVFELARRAKLTDLVGQAAITACGLLVSGRFKSLLSEFRISAPQYYPASITTKEGVIPYTFLHVLPIDMSYVDFSRSIFRMGHVLKNNKNEIVHFNNASEYMNAHSSKNHMTAIKVHRIFLNRPIDYDLFTIDFYNTRDCVISDNLKHAIDESDLSAIHTSEFNFF
ncbi:MAG: hypothetical protein H6590_03315 [Flavobacteriales bacterium]|nr:hypothetical protein [Flavobacteriales bacterium]